MTDPRINGNILNAVLQARKAEKTSAGVLSLSGIKATEKTQSELSAIAYAHQNLKDTVKTFSTHVGTEPTEGDGNPTVARVLEGLAQRAHAMDQVSVDTKIDMDAEEAPLIETEPVSKANPAKAGPTAIRKSDAAEAIKPERVAKRISSLIDKHIERLATTFGTQRFQGAVEMLRTDKMISGSDFKQIVKAFSGDKFPSRIDALKSLGVTGELLKTQKPKRQLIQEKRIEAWKKQQKAAIAEQKRLEKDGKTKPGAASGAKPKSGAARGDGNVARLVLKVE